jgi:hypothetical protein
MKITRKTVANKLIAYLHHKLSLAQLVDWAERSMMDGAFDEKHHDKIRDTLARLGVADVRAFGLTWEDCERFLQQLGYSARIEIVATPARPAALIREKRVTYGRK